MLNSGINPDGYPENTEPSTKPYQFDPNSTTTQQKSRQTQTQTQTPVHVYSCCRTAGAANRTPIPSHPISSHPVPSRPTPRTLNTTTTTDKHKRNTRQKDRKGRKGATVPGVKTVCTYIVYSGIVSFLHPSHLAGGAPDGRWGRRRSRGPATVATTVRGVGSGGDGGPVAAERPGAGVVLEDCERLEAVLQALDLVVRVFLFLLV